jgi:hypothetical protein
MQWMFKAFPYQVSLSIKRSVEDNSGGRIAARLPQRTGEPATLSECRARSAAARRLGMLTGVAKPFGEAHDNITGLSPFRFYGRTGLAVMAAAIRNALNS